MTTIIYIIRTIVMMIVTWTGVRLIGKKSIAEMTSYELAGIMLLTTVAAEPLVYKVTTKASVGVFTITLLTIGIGVISLKKFFYNVDSRPIIVVAEGKIQEKELKKLRMNVPLLMSELRVMGYQNLSDVRYAIVEPSGKTSVIPKSQSSPVTAKDMAIPTPPVFLSFPVIIDGEVNFENLTYLKKNRAWLMDQLKAFEVSDIEEVLMAQIDSTGQLYVNKKNNKAKIPNIF